MSLVSLKIHPTFTWDSRRAWGAWGVFVSVVWICWTSIAPSCLWAADPPILSLRDSGSLRIDGRLDDWPITGRWELGSKSQVLEGRPYWLGPESLSAKLYFSYDMDNLYVAAVVRQGHQANGATKEGVRPEGDGLELTVSSGWDEKRSQGWTRRDVSFLLSPGDKTHFPMVWNQARQETAPGARIIAKKTAQGYLVEAALPWSLFPGIHVAPGKTARFRTSVHSGDVLSGGMFFHLQEGGEEPGEWPVFRFDGSSVVDTPITYGQDKNDPEAARLDEGVKGELPRDPAVVSGVVWDASGRPVSGASIRLWPSSPGTRTGELGAFRVESSRLYDHTLVRAASDGLGSVVVPYLPNKPLTLRLPEREPPVWESGFLTSNPVRMLGGMCFEWPPSTLKEDVAFFGRAVTAGLEPILCPVLDPSDPGSCAREALALKASTGRSSRYWVLMPPGKPVDKYDALNVYRRAYTALKKAVPDSWVLATGTVADDVGSWEAFSNAEGDALDMALVKGDFRLASPWDATSEARSLSQVLRFLKDAPRGVLARLDDPVPVALWLQAGGKKAGVSIYPAIWLASVWAAWTSHPQGPLFFEWEGGPPEATSPEGRMAGLISEVVGIPLPSESYQPGLRVCARKSSDGVIHLLVVNENNRESNVVRVSLKKRKSGVMVDAALDRRFEFELPAESAAVVHIPLKGVLSGRWYGYHNVIKGSSPEILQIN